MSITITYPSALDYWLSCPNSKEIKTVAFKPVNIPHEPAIRSRISDEIRQLGFSGPLHVIVPSSSVRNHGSDFICHVVPKQIPTDSFVKLSDEIYIVSPEACILLAAKELDIPVLAVLMTDLFATYRKDAGAKFNQSNRIPITNKSKLTDYLEKAKSATGVRKARIALKYAFDCSNSPMESKIAVIACLPCMYGGFGLPRPKLNEIISLSKEGAAFFNRNTCCCDMVWLKYKTVVEYDSDLVHATLRKMHKDKNRSSALTSTDFKVIQVTRDNFRNHRTIEALFALIRKTLGLRSNRPQLEQYKDVRFELIKKLFLTSEWF